jgi:glutamate formiminotransferase/formiminotetrahydrofolate cyclodeaminase
MNRIVECVPNFSEGRDAASVAQIAAAIAAVPDVMLLDYVLDADHHRSVITFAGEPQAVVEAAVRAAAVAVELIDLNQHQGEHPRIGALDVLPFVPLKNVTMDDCAELAHQAGERLARELHIPVYLYDRAATRPSRINLADVRRGEFELLREEIETNPEREPDYGKPQIHPTAGATAVGARTLLIAYNINLGTADLRIAKRIAQAVRGSSGGLQFVKALGLNLKNRGQVQVSMNLVDYHASPLFRVFELVCREAQRYGVPVLGSEIIGLVPQAALNACADFYLRCENFSEHLVLEKRLETALEEYSQLRRPAHPPLQLVPALPESEPPAFASDFADEFTDDEWLGTFLDDVGAGTLAPGGGSVVAYTGALATALGALVCHLTLGKKKYEDVESEAREILAQLEQLSADLRAAVAEDADSLERKVEALQLPHFTEAENLARTSAIEEATKSLVGIRMRVAHSTLDTLDLLDELAEVGNRIAFADLATGAQLALTALRCTSYQVLSHLSSLSDDEFSRPRRLELEDLLMRGQATAEGIEELFFQLYPH